MRNFLIAANIMVLSASSQAHEGHAMANTIFHEMEHGLWLLASASVIAVAVFLARHWSRSK